MVALIGGCAAPVEIRVESFDAEPVGGVPVYLSGVTIDGLNGVRGKNSELPISDGMTGDDGVATLELDRRGFARTAVRLDDPTAGAVGVLTGSHADGVDPVKLPTVWTRLGVTPNNETWESRSPDERVVSIRRTGAER